MPNGGYAVWRGVTEIGIVGLGPWGLCVLERVINRVRALGPDGPQVLVHICEPNTPGSGMFDRNEPDYLIMNTPCGEHVLHPSRDESSLRSSDLGLYEWVVAQGYRWTGSTCAVTESGTPITPHDFLPRRLLAEYLEWFYLALLHEAPKNIECIHQAESVVDIAPVEGERERIVLASGRVLEVDHVVVTTGHTPNLVDQNGNPSLLGPYTLSSKLHLIPPGDAVAVEGMGLVALDVIMALTEGRGGSFTSRGDRMHYAPSGREPVISLFSRTGYPYCAKSPGNQDVTGTYRPVVCTDHALAPLRDAAGGRSSIDMRRDLLPLLLAEMEVRYYAQSALLAGGPEAEQEVRDTLGRAWAEGRYCEASLRYAERFGAFDAASHLFVGEGEVFVSSKDYESQVYDTVDSDLSAALMEGGASPVKAAYEVLRSLRDVMRSVIEFGALTPESSIDFQTKIRGRITRMVAGPPAFRCQQLLALMDAGIVTIPFGPLPTVEVGADGGFDISSVRLSRPHTEHVQWLVRGHMDDPTCHRSASSLYRHLHQRGRVQQCDRVGSSAGSIQLSRDYHPIGADEHVSSRIWMFGALTEGVRYYTGYIPSPKSRVRAFVDADECVSVMIGDG
jgi:hypothetical protein